MNFKHVLIALLIVAAIVLFALPFAKSAPAAEVVLNDRGIVVELLTEEEGGPALRTALEPFVPLQRGPEAVKKRLAVRAAVLLLRREAMRLSMTDIRIPSGTVRLEGRIINSNPVIRDGYVYLDLAGVKITVKKTTRPSNYATRLD